VITAAVVIIGNEVLSGRTQDQNLAYLGERLNALGIVLKEARVIRDEEDEIVSTVNGCRERYTYVFTTGGIGPTHDDITASSIAKAFGVPLERNAEAEKRLVCHYGTGDLNAARLKMADTPRNAVLIDNPVSQAPGFQVGNVFVLPGVPGIMRAMFEGLIPRLRGGAPIVSRTVSAFTTESSIALPLAAVQETHPTVEIGSYPFIRAGRFGTSLVMRGPDRSHVDSAAGAVVALLRSMAVEPIEDADASAA
jgi:molybdenum cofactor synthesis domain-containing protein